MSPVTNSVSLESYFVYPEVGLLQSVFESYVCSFPYYVINKYDIYCAMNHTDKIIGIL